MAAPFLRCARGGDTRVVIVNHRSGIAGAAKATGPTIVIDVFRAYSAAAYALAAGATRIVLASEVQEAREIAATIPDAVLMGEVDGVRPDGFNLGNSPGEIQAEPELVSERTIVHRSSAGTRCALAALDNGADPVFVSSLVVASATAAAVVEYPEVTVVASGIGGKAIAAEDVICSELLTELLLTGTADRAAAAEAVATHERARSLQAATFAHPEDVRLCTVVDRFSFAMRVVQERGAITVTATTDPRS